MRAARDSKDKAIKPRAQDADGASARQRASAKLPDLRALSDADLAALVGLVEREQVARRERKRREFLTSVREQAEALGVAPEEVAAALGRKSKHTREVSDRRARVAPKFRNPADPSQTWAGRGVKPRWMQALLAQGMSMDDFKIGS